MSWWRASGSRRRRRKRRATGNVPRLPFFPKVAAEILTPFMASHGFRLIQQKDWLLRYSRGDRAVSFSYDGMDVPRTHVSIAVGTADPDGRTSSIGLWKVLPESSDERDYWKWTFATEPELREVLARIIRELMPHAVSLWNDEETLVGLIAEQDVELEKDYQERVRSSELKAARRAFDEGRYAEARDYYVLLGSEEELSAADRRRLYLARKHLSTPQ